MDGYELSGGDAAYWETVAKHEREMRALAEKLLDQAKETLVSIYLQVAPDDAAIRQKREPYWKETLTVEELREIIQARVKRTWGKASEKIEDELIANLEEAAVQIEEERVGWDEREKRLLGQIARLEAELKKDAATEPSPARTTPPPPPEPPPDEWESLAPKAAQAAAQQDGQVGQRKTVTKAVQIGKGKQDWVTETVAMARTIAAWPERNDWTNQVRPFVTADRRVIIKNATMLWLIGTSGMSRRRVLQEIMVEAKALDPTVRLGRIETIISSDRGTSLEALGIVKVDYDTRKAGLSGSSTHLVGLTPLGEDVYRALFEQVAVPSELQTLRAHHHNNIHVLLVLEAADLLTDAGYCLLSRTPEPVETDQGEYRPDLKLADPRTGQVVYVEVERAGAKKSSERRLKWLRCHQATGGDIYVVTPNQSAMKAVSSEVHKFIRRPKCLWLTNISQVRAAQGPLTLDNLWLVGPDGSRSD